MTNLEKQDLMVRLDAQTKHLCQVFDEAKNPEYKRLVWGLITMYNKRYCEIAHELANA